jgi:hypothetical protein
MIDYNQLDEEFLDTYQRIRIKSLKEGLELRPIRGFINIFDHAERWRAINSDVAIMQAVQDLEKKDCHFISNVLFHCDPGRSMKDWHPKDLPGFNWHNWGKALDLNLKETDPFMERPLGERRSIFKQIVEEGGMYITPTNTLNFDIVHIQDEPEHPLGMYMAKEIDTEMYRRYQDGD